MDTRSDVYSLGVLLYELLTGSTPLEADRLHTAGYAEMQRLIREEEPPKPSTRLSTSGDELTIIAKHRDASPERLHKLVKGDLDWIVMKSLEKDRGRRYETVSSFATDVVRFLTEEPIAARPPSTSYRVRKFMRRNQGLVAAMSAVGVATIVGMLTTMWGLVRANQNAEQAHAEKTKAERLLVEYREELFSKALVAAMTGDSNTAESISKASDIGVSDARLEMLRGQLALYGGRPEVAIDHLKHAVDLSRGSVTAKGMLAVAHSFAGQTWDWRQISDELVDARPVTAEDLLFKAQATMVTVDPWDALRLAERAVEERRSALALAIRAEVRAWFAVHTGELKYAQLGVEDIHAANLLMGDSPYNLHVKLFANLVRMIVASDTGDSTAGLRAEANEAAALLESHFPHYVRGHTMRAWYFDYLGDFQQADRAWRQARQLRADTFLVFNHALMLYRSGRVRRAREELSPLPACLDKAIASLVLVDTPEGRDEAWQTFQRLNQQIHDDQTPLVEFVLRLPLYLGRLDDTRNLAKQWSDSLMPIKVRGLWASWNVAKIHFHAGKLGVEDLLREADRSGILHCDAHCLIGTRYLAQGNRKKAFEHCQQSVETGLTWFGSYQISEAIRNRLKDDPTWPDWIPQQPETARTVISDVDDSGH